jgi:hypothetical protein
MRHDPRVKPLFTEINKILHEKQTTDINIGRMTQIIFEITNIIQYSRLSDNNKDKAFQELIALQTCFENSGLVKISEYGEAGDRQLFLSIRSQYDTLQRLPSLGRRSSSGSSGSSGSPSLGRRSSSGSQQSYGSAPSPPPRSGSFRSSESPPPPPPRSGSPGTVVYESLDNRLPHTPPGSTPNATYAAVKKGAPALPPRLYQSNNESVAYTSLAHLGLPSNRQLGVNRDNTTYSKIDFGETAKQPINQNAPKEAMQEHHARLLQQKKEREKRERERWS